MLRILLKIEWLRYTLCLVIEKKYWIIQSIFVAILLYSTIACSTIPWCMIYCEFYVELFYIHSEHTQLSTVGAQYIVSGSWKHKLSFHACKGNRKWTKYWNFRCWCHVQIFRYMNSIYFILIFHYAAFKLPTYFHFYPSNLLKIII